MKPRSRQPNEFDSALHGKDDQAGQRLVGDASLKAGSDPFFLSDQADEIGTGGGALVTEEGRVSPVDFSSEELVLARDLHTLFPLEDETLPPYFIETICPRPATWQAPVGLTPRVTYRVFRRLHLPRRLFPPPSRPLSSQAGVVRLGRLPHKLAFSTVLMLILLSLVTVVPSFAQGVRVLLGRTGVQVTPHYPQLLLDPQVQVQYLSLGEVSQAVPFPVYWLGTTAQDYQYQALLLHVGQTWADGPVVELQYGRTSATAGSENLIVREFRPATGATVLLVVATGSEQQVQVGDQPAIYVDGQWVQKRQAVVWEYGTHAELIYEAHGLIFWISADQHAGANASMLEEQALALKPLYLGAGRSHAPVATIQPGVQAQAGPPNAQVAAALDTASLGEVVALIPVGASPQTGAAVYIALGAPPQENM
jgi:hypothetical protein